MLTFTFSVPDEHGGALRAAIEGLRNDIGEKLTGNHRYEKEEALTQAAAALGPLAAAINEQVERPEEDYE